MKAFIVHLINEQARVIRRVALLQRIFKRQKGWNLMWKKLIEIDIFLK